MGAIMKAGRRSSAIDTVVVAMGALCSGSLAMAQSMDACRAIKDAQERLTCLDASGKVAEPPKPAPAKLVPSLKGRRGLAANVRRTFLAHGQDRMVVSDEVQLAHRKNGMYTEQKGIGYPRPYISGVTSDPWLFQVMTKSDLLESARAAGFVAVEFDNRLGGKRFFDLRAGVPACDNAGFVCKCRCPRRGRRIRFRSVKRTLSVGGILEDGAPRLI